tara:strand:- start:396 stop:995 length:600 start_codon:yes stop_codon:yes gene_type:complete
MIESVVIKEVLKAFITLFVIMDPIGVLPIFLGLVKGVPQETVKTQVRNAIFVTSILVIIFIFAGLKVFNFFNIDLTDIRIAGGLILLILGIFYVLGIGINFRGDGNDISVPIGTPLLVGPGVITTLIILVGETGMLNTLVASVLAVFVTFLILNSGSRIYAILGNQWTEIISRIMGIVLAAIAVGYIKEGVIDILIKVI